MQSQTINSEQRIEKLFEAVFVSVKCFVWLFFISKIFSLTIRKRITLCLCMVNVNKPPDQFNGAILSLKREKNRLPYRCWNRWIVAEIQNVEIIKPMKCRQFL